MSMRPGRAAGGAAHLEHGVGEEGLQRPLLAVGLGLVVLEELVEVSVLLAVRQDLQAVLVVAHELLVDVEHGQQDVEQVGCKEAELSGQRGHPRCEVRGRRPPPGPRLPQPCPEKTLPSELTLAPLPSPRRDREAPGTRINHIRTTGF